MFQTQDPGVSPPPPAGIVCARCGSAIEPGMESCPACGARQAHLEPASGSAPLRRLGSLFVVLGLGLGALALWLPSPTACPSWRQRGACS